MLAGKGRQEKEDVKVLAGKGRRERKGGKVFGRRGRRERKGGEVSARKSRQLWEGGKVSRGKGRQGREGVKVLAGRVVRKGKEEKCWCIHCIQKYWIAFIDPDRRNWSVYPSPIHWGNRHS